VAGSGQTAGLGLALAHVRAEQKMFWRNPVAAVFTFAFPLFFLLIFAELSPDGLMASGRFIERFVPLMSAFGLISACFGNLVIFVCERRERGIFKRRRATPVPASAVMAGLIGSATIVALVLVLLVILLGHFAYDVAWPAEPALLAVTMLLGSACFCALGIAISRIIPNEEASPAVSQGLMYPIVFISGTFIPVPDDSILDTVAGVLPVRALNELFLASFDQIGTDDASTNLGILAAWMVVGTVLSILTFRWEPVGRR
jgi:ABC-2 type transport system permease protein